MTPENKKENIRLEVDQAEEVLREAKVLAQEGLHKGAISRTYYYVFHLVKALLYTLGLEPKTHEGAGHLLNLHFIREGKIDPRFGKLFSRLLRYRQESDYDPAAVFRGEDAEEELSLAEEFSQQVRRYLEREGYLGPG